MTTRYFAATFFACLVAVGLTVGCAKSGPEKSAPTREAKTGETTTHDHGDGTGTHSHDPHDVAITEADVKKPTDYTDAVARIMEYRNAIERDTATATPGLAHRSLDELDIVLKWLPGIARDSGVPKEHWETINTTSQELQELFEKVHTNIDNHKNPDFPSIKEAVDERIARLKAAAAKP